MASSVKLLSALVLGLACLGSVQTGCADEPLAIDKREGRGFPPTVLAQGEWSAASYDTIGNGIRGRLVLAERRFDEKREVAVYLELCDARESVGGEPLQVYCDFARTNLGPDAKTGLHCELRRADGQVVKPSVGLFSGAAPKSEWASLSSDASVRLRATPFGILRAQGMAIVPSLGDWWEIAGDDPEEYSLSGVFKVDPAADQVPANQGRVWRGTLELRALKIKVAQKK